MGGVTDPTSPLYQATYGGSYDSPSNSCDTSSSSSSSGSSDSGSSSSCD